MGWIIGTQYMGRRSAAMAEHRSVRRRMGGAMAAASVLLMTAALASPSLASGVSRDMGAFQPDARIKHAHGAFVGDGVVNTTAAHQKRTATIQRGSGTTFTIAIKNIGPGTDRFFVHAIGDESTRSHVFYYQGTSDITPDVDDGTYETPPVAAGASFRIRVGVAITNQANDGYRLSRLVNVSSAITTGTDTVKFTVKLP
jgi:hypothetical protein